MSKLALIADIGGTNARFGIVNQDGVQNLQYLECKNYLSLTEAANAYLNLEASKNFPRPELGVFAVAGPVSGDIINFTALPWSFRTSVVERELNFKKLYVMNDFEAVALAIPPISGQHLQKICGPDPVEGKSKGIIGPGTGLGVASLTWCGEKYTALPGEGGHVTMPATTQREFNIFQQLKVKYHHISAERVCSGKGLENLYNAIRALDHRYELPDLEAPEISENAIKGKCAVCKESLDLMLAFMGRIAGNLALVLNAQGGIYIAGGIPTKLGDYFLKSRFVEEFKSKGRMSELMDKMPVYMIKHDAIGLLGLEAKAKYELSLLGSDL